jgi:hypothetical protein
LWVAESETNGGGEFLYRRWQLGCQSYIDEIVHGRDSPVLCTVLWWVCLCMGLVESHISKHTRCM